ncbi:MAG: NADH-quinone oxidoreductase subunit NuoE [Deltaproteobacteria bacterium]|nr:NADH-quinone oxidoreductase subunit NuoE [Deltaproteobacteria bacterium]
MTIVTESVTAKEEDLTAVRDILRNGNDLQPRHLIAVLQQVQEVYGYLPENALEEISFGLKVPLARIYGVCTFYSQFRMAPLGKHIIKVCDGTACHVRGSNDLLEELKSLLGINPGETTEDGLFSFETVMCIGACGLAPVIMVGDETYGKLTSSKLSEVIDSYRNLKD